MLRTLLALACGLLAAHAAHAAPEPLSVPPWLFPGPGDMPVGPYNSVVRLHLPDSSMSYTDAQLFDQFAVPDWHPKSHPPLPPVVAHGRRPEVYACGYCHLANGLGRPENASLAGLPKAYLLAQLADFKSGARRIALKGTYAPSDAMLQIASHVSGADAEAAADYFSGLKLTQRSHVIEGADLPGIKATAWTYVLVPGAAAQTLGERLFEVAPDALRDARRDDELQYDAYVPPGSVARGKAIATAGAAGEIPCVICHGPDLRGVAMFPPIAGRSASYLLRQLYAFRNGTRNSAAAQAMVPVVERLQPADMIAVAAYAASLEP
jgi:cytochrome c553